MPLQIAWQLSTEKGNLHANPDNLHLCESAFEAFISFMLP
jgi:hypothetical protein